VTRAAENAGHNKGETKGVLGRSDMVQELARHRGGRSEDVERGTGVLNYGELRGVL
jgi:hypothetical protein